MKYTFAEVKKAVISVAGFVLTVLTVALAVPGVIPTAVLPYTTVFIGVCTSYGVFAARNREVPGKHRA